MELYITRSISNPGEILAAYWAESRGDVIDAYESEGIDVAIGCTMPATPEEALLYHGPDFQGRRLVIIERYECGQTIEIMYVAADCLRDAMVYATDLWGQSANLIGTMDPEKASEIFGPDWDK